MSTARLITRHSILPLDARHPLTQRALLDAQDMHRLVMSGFRGWVADGQRDARAQMGVLSTWSVDLKTDTLLIVVQSRITPNWTTIPKTALRAPVTTQAIDQRIHEGDTYTFRTVICPTSTRRDAKTGQSTRKRLPHTQPERVRQWIGQRFQNPAEPAHTATGVHRIGAAADPAALAVRILPPVVSDQHQGLKISRAEVCGTLTVTDPDAFLAALTQGLGRGRAYSCGLLLTRPG
ncbi:type I-E CRISPR-associated protein Cas6/Cse3/CasE [Kitasatospora sp. GAS204B]|uniref:type I-E CRISPR-associated protein Cas6/Cse3/CasE n=1 Tax=unclassified Kitasatospora TaxID=2633591 RepID=UPI002476EB1F|nr:type I-E CRISPR-associated protein Cas6/Cse3/CasE [Kitasatospora sp. GAS204B]